MRPGPGTYVRRRAAAFGASVTIGVAVAADAVAGEHPLHTATLGLVALVVALLRLRLAGRHAGLFAATYGAIVAQPVLHAAMKLVPDAPGSAPGALGHVVAETSTTALHVLVAAVIVAAVAGAEQMFLAVAALRPFTHWLLLPARAAARPERPAPVTDTSSAPAPRQAHVAAISRRGPPPAVRAAAV